MNLSKSLLILEIIGDDYNPDELHLSCIPYLVVQLLGMLFMTISLTLCLYVPILGIILYLGSVVTYVFMLMINNHDDASMLFTIPLTIGIAFLINCVELV